MAAIIRVKRRLDEDPAESLIIQYKKNKPDNPQTSETNKFCLSLVTTVKSKEETVSKQVQKALRRYDLQSSYKAHEPKPLQHTREEKRAKAKANRYKIVNSRRALAVDSADNVSDSESEQSKEVKPSDPKGSVIGTIEATQAQSQSVAGDSVSGTSEAGGSSEASPSSSDNSVSLSDGAVSANGDQLVHVFDVEQDSPGARQSVDQHPTQSGITLNGENLISQPAPPAPESNYVYDLYYINNNNQQYNFRDLENILSIEALHDELVTENDREVQCDEVYDDEDDSNDENNWRNDYPDDDPDISDDEFDPDMLSMAEPRSYSYRDDDFLSEAVGTRLHLFASSSSDDEEDEYGDGELGNSYEAYMKRTKRELQEVNEGEVEDCD